MSLETTEPVAEVKAAPPFQPYLPLMALTTIIWGAAFPITRAGLSDVPPATFALSRFVVAIAILLPLMLVIRRGWHFDRRTWGRVVLAGLLGFTVIQLGQNWGLTLSTASDISILAATEPVTIALLAAFFLHERPSRVVWMGLLLSMVGVWFVIGINPLSLAGGEAGGGNRLLGDLIFLVGTVGFSAYNVMNRSLTQRHNGLELTSGAVLSGIAGLAPFALFELTVGGKPVHWTGAAIGGLLYASLLVTVFGFLALSWSLKRIPAAKVALLFYLQPVSGVLIAWLGGEKLSWNFGLGALLIFCGVYLAERRGVVRKK